MSIKKRKLSKTKTRILEKQNALILSKSLQNNADAISNLTDVNHIAINLQNDIQKSMSISTKSLLNITNYNPLDISSMINPLKDIQTDYFERLKESNESFMNILFPVPFTDFITSFKSYNFNILEGIAINPRIDQLVTNNVNEIQTETKLTDANLEQNGELNLDFMKSTSSDKSSEISYQLTERIATEIELPESWFSKTDKNISLLVTKSERIDLFMDVIENNPFPFYKMKHIDYSKDSGFTINHVTNVLIPSKSHMDFVCRVFFSGIKEHLTDEWFSDEVIEQLKPYAHSHEADWEKITWKSIQEAIYKINEKVAMETTKKDMFVFPRSEVVMLNPRYFQGQ